MPAYDPIGQGMHDVAHEMSEYVPVEQAMHSVDPIIVANCPDVQ